MSEACSFCGAGPAQVGYLFTGPDVWICDGCVRASYEILQSLEEKKSADTAVPMDDPIMATIAQVQQAALQGHKEQAKSAYEQLWTQAGKPLHRITIAHY